MYYNHPNYLLISKDLITFGLTIWGLIIASMGLSTWKKQIKGGKEFQVYYKLNYYLLELRNAIRYVRNPAIFPSETYKAKQYFEVEYPDGKKEDFEKSSYAYVYEMRWKKITIAYTKMESYLIGAEVLWGSDIIGKVKPLKNKINELSMALRQNSMPLDYRTLTPQQIHNIIYNKGDENKEDDFSEEVSKYINEIRNYLKNKNI